MKSTEELYGINPKVLADLPYKKAIELKLGGLLIKRNELVTKMAEQQPYETLCELEHEYRGIIKAIELNDLMLEELKDD